MRYLVEYVPITFPDGLEESQLGLHFKVDDEMFIKNKLTIKCTASIAHIYWQSNQQIASGVPKKARVNGGRAGALEGRFDSTTSKYLDYI